MAEVARAGAAAGGAAAGGVAPAVLEHVMDGCKRRHKRGRRRPSYSQPMFREVLDAFGALGAAGERARAGRLALWRGVAERARRAAGGAAREYFAALGRVPVREEDARQIDKDLERSGTAWELAPDRAQRLGMLRRVLRAYAAHERQHGYTQGVNLFAAEFLHVTEDEETAFWLVLHVCQSSGIAEGYHTRDMRGLRRDMWVVQQLLEQYLPDLVLHFKACGMDGMFTYVFIGPFLSLFASVLPPAALHGFFDVLLANGVTTLFAAWLSFFKINQPAFAQETDADGLLAAINLALASWGSQDSFQRSLLQWCMLLDAGTVADFRKNAPMHFFNTELVLKAAQEAAFATLPSASSASSASRRGRGKGELLLAPPPLRVRRASPRRRPRGDRARGDATSPTTPSPTSPASPSSSSSALCLRVVWIASNLRNPLAYQSAEEYRQAAVRLCREVLALGGYGEMLPADAAALGGDEQHAMAAAAGQHPLSASTVLPSPRNVAASTGGLDGDRVSRRASLLAGRAKQLVIQTKLEMDAFHDSGAQLWRSPECAASLEALLAGLSAATSDLLLREVQPQDAAYPLLERLALSLDALRDAIPVYRHADLLLDRLVTLLEQQRPGRPSSGWRRRIASVFRSSRRASPTSRAAPVAARGRAQASSPSSSGSSPSAAAASAAQGASGAGSAAGKGLPAPAPAPAPATAASSSPSSPSSASAATSSSDGGGDDERALLRIELVALLTACKADAENSIVGLYQALPGAAAGEVEQLFRSLASDLQDRLCRLLEPGAAEAFLEDVNYQLRLWALDSGASLFAEQWTRARDADLRLASQALQGHRRNLSLASSALAGSSRELSPRVNKVRSRSAPELLASMGTRLCRLEEGGPDGRPLEGMDLGQVLERSLLRAQHCRALFWAVRSNYQLVLEMSRQTVALRDEALSGKIQSLVSALHSTTYDMQAQLCEAARIEHVVSQLEAFDRMFVHAGPQQDGHGESSPTAVRVLLDDLEDQIKLVKSLEWRSYLARQFDNLEGGAIL